MARRPSAERARAALGGIDPEPLISALEPLTTERRRAQLQTIASRRLESVRAVMDAPHDPHNGAAVLRSCEAFGVYRIHVIERQHPFSASAAVAKGAERWVEVHRHPSVADALPILGQARHELVAAHPAGELEPADLAAIPRLALVFGNEHDGISEALLEACTRRVRVPMRGLVESLNVSVTAAILLFCATEGRSGDLSPAEQRRLYARGLLLSVPRAFEVARALGVELNAHLAEF